MRKLRVATFFLVMLLVILPAEGCAETRDTTDDTTTATKTYGEASGTEAETTELTPEIPDGYNLDGYTFSIFMAGNWSNIEFDANTMNGDPLNDAQFERTTVLEDTLNCTLNIVKDYTTPIPA